MPFLLLKLADLWRAPAPDPARVAWLGQHIYAHRGLHGPGAAENSLSAFSFAIARGLGIECDVQRSSDGHAMVFHDFDLDRLTDCSGAVAARTVGELTAINLRGTSETIPTLRDVLAQLSGAVPLLIEIKAPSGRRMRSFCRSVRRDLEGYTGPVAIMSFNPNVSRWFAQNAPNIVRGLVVTEENRRTMTGAVRRHLALWHATPDFLAYDIADLPSRFAAAQKKRGLPLLSWTVRNAEQLERAAKFADAPIAEGGGIVCN